MFLIWFESEVNSQILFDRINVSQCNFKNIFTIQCIGFKRFSLSSVISAVVCTVGVVTNSEIPHTVYKTVSTTVYLSIIAYGFPVCTELYRFRKFSGIHVDMDILNIKGVVLHWHCIITSCIVNTMIAEDLGKRQSPPATGSKPHLAVQETHK